MRVGQFVLLMLVVAASGAAIALTMLHRPLFAVPAAFVAGSLPLLWAWHRKTRRVQHFERLFPDALVDGKPATVDEAVEAAADYLYRADMPLVYGLSNVTCETQREAVALAELIGGVVDSHTSL